jgi:glucose/arabinose dehydrogenase
MHIRVVAVLVCILLFSCENRSTDESSYQRKFITTNPDPAPLSPEESIKKIQLPPGYRVELVASEPMVQEPVALAWDGNGRMYVVQMNTYMKDANATEEYEPTSRIMRLEDSDNDGLMDKVSVFIDSLYYPVPYCL